MCRKRKSKKINSLQVWKPRTSPNYIYIKPNSVRERSKIQTIRMVTETVRDSFVCAYPPHPATNPHQTARIIIIKYHHLRSKLIINRRRNEILDRSIIYVLSFTQSIEAELF